MCGIFGAIGLPVPDQGIERVLRILDHRGPDGRGIFLDPESAVTLAHTRLAVIDIESGAQPIASEDGNIVLVANGEIYDFENIRRSLEEKGHRFKTRSDSEVIIYLYKEYGLACFDRLRGEFAFLLYDRSKRLLIAARDRFGIKPLYFSRLERGFVFASEMKALFASGLVQPKLNAAGIDPLLDRASAAAPFPFEGIHHVPPGCYVAIDVEGLHETTVCYWSNHISAAATEVNSGFVEIDAERQVLEALEKAVQLRLRSDVPVGLYLSGGFDSSFIGALMGRNLGSKLHSFSIAFEGSDRNEGTFARRAADAIGTIHHEITVTRQMLWHNLEQALWFSELPFATLAPVGKFLLSKEARKHVTVVLTGEGADEVFLGYRNFFKRAAAKRSARGGSEQLRRLKLGGLPVPIVKRLSLLLFDKRQRSHLASARAAASSPNRQPRTIDTAQERRIAAMPFDILCYLGDREEMAHSIEARLPFLDHHLFDVARAIPPQVKMRGGIEKGILRDAAKGLLPEDLRMRRKLGFMLTSDKIDLFGSDRGTAAGLQRYLSRQAFERAGVFSYRTYVAISWLARVPARVHALRRLRVNANKVLMYTIQVHMLHRMFVEEPLWEAHGEGAPTAAAVNCTAASARKRQRSAAA